MTIWKFVIPVEDEVIIEMPANARLLTVQLQARAACVWAIVDPEARRVQRRFYVRGTGHPMDKSFAAPYVGTFQMLGGTLAFHVFDGGEV